VLDGSATDPDGGTIVTYLWTQESGPSVATLSGEDAEDLSVSDLEEGEYIFFLTVTDDEGDEGFDQVTVTVLPEGSTQDPVADAGEDQTITLPENSIVLDGSASDPDGGTIATYLWTQESGPSPATLEGTDTEDLSVSDLVAGDYVFRLTVTDDEGEEGFDEVTVTVLPEGGTQDPVADAGEDQTIVLPDSSVVLDGSASDPDGGTIVTYVWTQESGPSPATLEGTDTEDLSVSDLEEGEYVFRLTVIDDEGEEGFDEATVTVLAEGSTLDPVADAGEDQTIVLPENSIVLDGSASDPDGGTIVTYLWTQETGPSQATLEGADTEDLSASDLVVGSYVFRLTVTDDEGEEGFDEVTVTVLSEGSAQPEVDAGPDLTLVLPDNSIVLDGTAIDPDGGTIVTYVWTQESGPSAATLSGEDSEDLSVSDLEEGEYIFRLTVTDDEGETNFDEAAVTVTRDEPEEKMEAILLENPSNGGVAKVMILNRPSEVVLFGFYFHDATGRLIGQYNAEAMEVDVDSYEIPVGTLRDGLYYVTLIVNQGERMVLKLLVKN
jgi:uncharacterized protein (DUF2249 family)